MKTYQVVGIGNAIVDVLTQCDDHFLDWMGIEKGIMQLVDRERGEMLYAAMKERKEAPGSSTGKPAQVMASMPRRLRVTARVPSKRPRR